MPVNDITLTADEYKDIQTLITKLHAAKLIKTNYQFTEKYYKENYGKIAVFDTVITTPYFKDYYSTIIKTLNKLKKTKNEYILSYVYYLYFKFCQHEIGTVGKIHSLKEHPEGEGKTYKTASEKNDSKRVSFIGYLKKNIFLSPTLLAEEIEGLFSPENNPLKLSGMHSNTSENFVFGELLRQVEQLHSFVFNGEKFNASKPIEWQQVAFAFYVSLGEILGKKPSEFYSSIPLFFLARNATLGKIFYHPLFEKSLQENLVTPCILYDYNSKHFVAIFFITPRNKPKKIIMLDSQKPYDKASITENSKSLLSQSLVFSINAAGVSPDSFIAAINSDDLTCRKFTLDDVVKALGAVNIPVAEYKLIDLPLDRQSGEACGCIAVFTLIEVMLYFAQNEDFPDDLSTIEKILLATPLEGRLECWNEIGDFIFQNYSTVDHYQAASLPLLFQKLKEKHGFLFLPPPPIDDPSKDLKTSSPTSVLLPPHKLDSHLKQ